MILERLGTGYKVTVVARHPSTPVPHIGKPAHYQSYKWALKLAQALSEALGMKIVDRTAPANEP